MARNQQAGPPWTDADRERVARLLERGLSAAKIGQEMGISRGAAIGRIFRNDRLRTLMKRPEGAATKPRQWRMQIPPSKVKIKDTPPPVVELPPPPMRYAPLKDLRRGDCCWPCTPHNVARDQHLFCGAGCRKGERWCPYHCSIGYVPRERRYG